MSVNVVALSFFLIKWQLFIAVMSVFVLVGAALLKEKLAAKSLQTLHRLILATVLLAPLLAGLGAGLIAPSNVLKPALQIGTETSKGVLVSEQFKTTLSLNSLPGGSEMVAGSSGLQTVTTVVLALFWLHLVYRILLYTRDRMALKKLIANASVVKQLGQVKIAATSALAVPLAARHRGFAVVLLPVDLVASALEFVLATKHEIQHHRQKDLQWNLLLESARFIAGWNPLLRLWLDRIEECDELTCDEALLGRRSVEPTAYATCLYQVATAALNNGAKVRLAGTAGMAAAPNFLKRRIEMVFQKRKNDSRLIRNVVLTTAVSVICATAWSAESLIKDRRVSLQQGERLASKTRTTTGIPIAMNKHVLYWLNQATGSSKTRFFMRNTLKRMAQYRPLISAKLQAAGMPVDVMAVPIIETGYQNTQEIVAAGIWSFVPATARRYGMKVNDDIDERLDVAKQTDAAIAYLGDNRNRFGGDWHLALLSYNIGENTVEKIIAKAGHKDVFKLVDEGFLTAKEGANYVPKFTAALIIMNNPDLVNE